MIHYRTPQMARVACRTPSPQAVAARTIAVSCPACRATHAFRLAAEREVDWNAVHRYLAAVELARAADAVHQRAQLTGYAPLPREMAKRVKLAERAYATFTGPRRTPSTR